MSREEFDWIDDAFDEEKSSHAAPKGAGRQAAGCIGAVIVLALVVGLVLAAAYFGLFVGIGLIDSAMQ